MNVYFISGLGANQKAFQYLSLPEGFTSYFIDWKQPLKNETLQEYTKRMTKEVDTSKPFILIGLSFGGIVAQEMNRFIHPEKTILISSIKSRKEMPRLFKFSSKIAAHKLIPIRFFTNDHFLSYGFFRNIYYIKEKAPDFYSFFTHRDPQYLRWSIHQIVNWKPTLKIENLYHIHGDQDIVFPHKKLEGKVEMITKGSHIMIMQRAKAVNETLNRVLITKT
ncbi:hypothetical protein UJ101_01764 [Flavobacteriaceae bacterium UJ101]|nr:hypothetical protein UJ101_01764 [Flavobacteriaceae bacterium UJ101]